MKFKQSVLYGFLFGMLFLAGCGGGGGTAAPQAQAPTATLKLSTSGTLAPGTSLAGIGVSIVLPAGVTVRIDAGGAVSSGVVAVSGVAAPGTVLAPVYTPASGGNPATLAFAMASNDTAGFGTGEFATVVCDRASGTSPTPADFTIPVFQPIDLSGNPVGGLTASVAVVLN